MDSPEVLLKRFENPDEIRTFPRGKFEVVNIGGIAIGRATYQPGWRYSEHVANSKGDRMCHAGHVGIVLAGCATAAITDSPIIELRAGDLFYIPPGPPGHDSWVVGGEQYVSLHLMGATNYGDEAR